eukprot:g14863.t1
MVAVHRWRSLAKVDPHGVTWRQLVTFARWYRWRWGNEHQVFFWIDSCCVPEIRGKLPEKPKKRPDLWADDERDDQEPMLRCCDAKRECRCERQRHCNRAGRRSWV